MGARLAFGDMQITHIFHFFYSNVNSTWKRQCPFLPDPNGALPEEQHQADTAYIFAPEE